MTSATARPGSSWRSLDDGQPIAPAGQPGPGPGRGLIGIRERAALHGGTCDGRAAAGRRLRGPGQPPAGCRRQGRDRRVGHGTDATEGDGRDKRNGYEPDGPAGSAVWPAAATPAAHRGRCRAGTGAGGRGRGPGGGRSEPGRAGPGGRDRRCPAADAAAGVPAVAPGLGAGRGGRGHAWPRRSPERAVVLGWRRRWRCTRWPRTARGGRRPGRASPPGPSWPGRLCATAAVRAAPRSWSRSAWPRCSAWVSRRLRGCPAPTSVSCGPAPPAAAASRNWRPGGRSPKSRPGSGASCTTSSPTPSA